MRKWDIRGFIHEMFTLYNQPSRHDRGLSLRQTTSEIKSTFHVIVYLLHVTQKKSHHPLNAIKI